MTGLQPYSNATPWGPIIKFWMLGSLHTLMILHALQFDPPNYLPPSMFLLFVCILFIKFVSRPSHHEVSFGSLLSAA